MTNGKLKEAGTRIHALAVSKRGRNLLTFLVFLAISTAFWFIMALNNEVQHEFEVPLEISNVPGDVTMLSDVPSKISVNIKDKGISLLRWEWGNVPALELDYQQFQNTGKHLKMNNTQLTGAVRSAFGGTTNIVEVKPDSLYITFTNHPGVKKPVQLTTDIGVSPQHILSGRLKLSTDSVTVFSAGNIPHSLVLRTDSVILAGLTDTTYVDVNVIQPEGMRVFPPTLRLTIPVEPLIAKKRQIPVEVIGAPQGVRVLTFPSLVDVSYTLPISAYNHDNAEIKAFAAYDSMAKKLPLTISRVPASYRNVALPVDSVEYLVEHR